MNGEAQRPPMRCWRTVPPRCICLMRIEYFEVRFESIGGLGAHAAGQVLATAVGRENGLERRPLLLLRLGEEGFARPLVSCGWRPGDRPIRTSAPIERPDVIVVFHAALLRNAATLRRLKADGTLIYNAPAGVVPAELAALPRTARIIRVDAHRHRHERAVPPERRDARNAVHPVSVPRRASVLDALPRNSPASTRKRSPPTSARSSAGAAEFEQLKASARADGDLSPMPSRAALGLRDAAGRRLLSRARQHHLERPHRRRASAGCRCSTGQVHPLRRVRPGLPGLLPGLGRSRRRRQVRAQVEGHRLPLLQGMPALRRVLSRPARSPRQRKPPGWPNKLRVPLFPELIA